MSTPVTGPAQVLRSHRAVGECRIGAGLYALRGRPLECVDAPVVLTLSVNPRGEHPARRVELHASGKDAFRQECYLPAGGASLVALAELGAPHHLPYELELRPLGRMASLRHRVAIGLRKYPRLVAAVQAVRSLIRPSRGLRLPVRDAAAYRRELDRLEARQAQVIESWQQDRKSPDDPQAPTFLLILSDGEDALLRRSVYSVLSQGWPKWRLLCAVPAPVRASCAADARIEIRDTADDLLCVVRNLPGRGDHDWLIVLRPGDQLVPHALASIAAFADARPNLELVYTDEDRLDDAGHRIDPQLKSGWNPELLNTCDGVGALAAIRFRSLPQELQRPEDLGWQFAQRLRGEQVGHLPVVAVSCAKQPTVSGPGTRIEAAWPLPSPAPRVSIIVPTRDGGAHLQTCIESLRSKTRYPDVELIVMDNQSQEPRTVAFLRSIASLANIRVLSHDAPFNFSEICNRGVQVANGQIVVLLNDDTEVLAEGWLEELVRHAARPEVGAVGAKLYYPDGTIQHAGVALGLGGVAGHICLGAARKDEGYLGRLQQVQAIGAVTAACLAVERDKYLAVGGMDAQALPVAFNDVDLCLKLRERGWHSVWTPHAELLHHESKTRGPDTTPAKRKRFQLEYAVMRRRWAHRLDADPYYHPRLSRWQGDMRLDTEAGPWMPPAAEMRAVIGEGTGGA